MINYYNLKKNYNDWYTVIMFIFDNFYCDTQIMVDNQYCWYYYVCQYIFLSDYCNVMFITIKNGKNLP